MQMNRRGFLRASGTLALAFGGLRHAHAAPDAGYGELRRDPARALDLPPGFRYTTISRAGETMDDGLLVPSAHDGMAAFAGPDGRTLVVRNHELSKGSSTGPFGRRKAPPAGFDAGRLYDAEGPGGTTTLVFDPKAQRLERHFLSLAGTMRNCAGGPTPWGSWLSCEETVVPGHGWVFEVPATADIRLADPVPLKAMGRFNHEAVAIDPATGIAYLTEDKADGLLYRFLPEEPGRLRKGGRLQALALRDRRSADTSNYGKAPSIPQREPLAVEWIDLENVEAPKDDLRKQGYAKGAARFVRGEGLWHGGGEIYFACTTGGRNKKGQVWRLTPARNAVELFVEPNDAARLDNADNLTVAPWGDLIVCENGSKGNAVVGITPEGRLYPFARNAKSSSEFAGGCFSPDGTTLFVNIQKDGLTLAITGPWKG